MAYYVYVRSWYRVAGPTLLLCSRGGGLAQTIEDEAKYVSLGRTARGGEPRASLGFWYRKDCVELICETKKYIEYEPQNTDTKGLFDMVISDNKLGAKTEKKPSS